MDVVPPIVEVWKANNGLLDPVIQHMPGTFEQPVMQHASQEDVDTTLRGSTWMKKSKIPSDYIVYL